MTKQENNDYSYLTNEELLLEYGKHYSWELNGSQNNAALIKEEIIKRMIEKRQ